MWNQPPRNASSVAVGFFEVALHHRVAAQHDLADGRAVARHRRQGLGIGHHQPCEGRDSARPGAPSGRARSSAAGAAQSVLPGAERGRAVGLGQAVEVRDAEAHALHGRDDGASAARRRRSRPRRRGRTRTFTSSGAWISMFSTIGAPHMWVTPCSRDQPGRSAPGRPCAGRHACRRPRSPPRCRSSRCSGTSAASRGRPTRRQAEGQRVAHRVQEGAAMVIDDALRDCRSCPRCS